MSYNTADRIIREAERKQITGRSSSSWWRDEKEGKAPRRIRIGEKAVGWRLSELMAWLDSKTNDPAPQPVAVPGHGKRRGRKPKCMLNVVEQLGKS